MYVLSDYLTYLLIALPSKNAYNKIDLFQISKTYYLLMSFLKIF